MPNCAIPADGIRSANRKRSRTLHEENHSMPSEESPDSPSPLSLKALRAIIDASPFGILLFDESEKVIYANQPAEELFGNRFKQGSPISDAVISSSAPTGTPRPADADTPPVAPPARFPQQSARPLRATSRRVRSPFSKSCTGPFSPQRSRARPRGSLRHRHAEQRAHPNRERTRPGDHYCHAAALRIITAC